MRIIWGNAINFVATIKSFQQKYIPNLKAKEMIIKKTTSVAETLRKGESGKGIKWDKTDHVFLEKRVLSKYYRKIGDILIERGILNSKELKEVLKTKETIDKDMNLGSYLVESKLITETQLLESLSEMLGYVFLKTEDFSEFIAIGKSFATKEELIKHKILPIMARDGEVIIAISEYSSKNAVKMWIDEKGATVCFGTVESILKGIEKAFTDGETYKKEEGLILSLYQGRKITTQQALIAKKYVIENGFEEKNLLKILGLFKND